MKTGTKAARQRGVGDERAQQVRDLEGDREGGERAGGPEVARRDDLADRARRSARGPSRSRRSAVLSAIRARPGGVAGSGTRAAIVGAAAAVSSPRRFHVMANIASQKKRILRTERERLENRRYTSAIKTYFRRLQAAVAEPATTRPPTPSTASSSARSTRPSSAARCTRTPALARSPARRSCAAASPPSGRRHCAAGGVARPANFGIEEYGLPSGSSAARVAWRSRPASAHVMPGGIPSRP